MGVTEMTDFRPEIEWGTTGGLIRYAAAKFADSEAISDGPRSISYADVLASTQAVSASFISLGINPGDRVAVWAPNLWEWIPVALGLQSVGAVLVPLNTRYKGREASYILRRSGARALVTMAGFLGNDYVSLLRDALDEENSLPSLETTVVLRDENPPEGTLGWSEFLSIGENIGIEEVEQRAAAVRPDDLSDLLFTSGTTGNPKGVMQTHSATLRAFYAWSSVVGLRHGDRYLIVNPFFHAFGYKAGWLSCIMTGATILPQAVFDSDEVMARIGRDRVSVLPGPPTLLQGILNHPERNSYDLSSLRLTVTGAAAIPVVLITRLRDELTFETVITGYGLTETCGIATMCRFDDDPETIATTSGRAIPDVEVLVFDEAGNEVPRGEPGEIVVRGYNLMVGYFEDPDETTATIDPLGWLHTGDVGVMDERGYLRITDRTKDMFIVGGFNAYPAEIENLMLRNDQIAQVAVVGVPDSRLGEVGMAFVVTRPNADPDPDALLSWCRAEMANFKAPRYVVLVDELPLNATGKVLKFELRERGREIVASGLQP
jgi:acyl-CoA synthetase (AMP-forming)/AMP-acid ligase II